MMERLASILKQGKRMVFFGGAGVSTESGIPDFRSEDSRALAARQFGFPSEVLLSLEFFERNPQVFFEYMQATLSCQGVEPNQAHHILAQLEREGKLAAVVTQNIDGLHQAAGAQTVHELHGSSRRNFCVICGRKYLDIAPLKRKGAIPLCENCGGIVRPDIVLYGESLDGRVMASAAQAIAGADVLLVGGTSLTVYPAAGMLHYYQGTHLILINKQATDQDSRAELIFRDSIGKVLAEAVQAL